MKDKPTNELDSMLDGMRPDQLDGYYKENMDYLANGKKAFYYYMKDIIEAKKIRLMDVYSYAGVSESYGAQIFRMEKPTKNRDLIIRFCVAGHLSLYETNRALKLYGMPALYSKDKRDAALIVAIQNRIYDLADIDDILEKQGFLPLSAINSD